TPAAARLYSLQIVRMIESSPKCLTFTVYRPSPQHSGAMNSRSWPSPAGAFIRTAAWTPLANESQGRLAQAWMIDVDANPPPGLRLLDPELRQLIASSLNVRAPLVSAGLKEYGRAASAWDFLRVAPSLLDVATPQQAEQVSSAAREAWGMATLSTVLPADLSLIGRRSGRIIARPIAGVGRILVLDTDDRQMLNAVSQSDPDVLLFEPPLVRASTIADLLALRSPGRFERSSILHAAYDIHGVPFSPDASDPFIEQAISSDLRSLIVLTLRYRAASFEGNPADVLDRLARLRLRWVDAISIRLAEVVQPLPGFAHKAVLAQGEAFDTVLAPVLARNTNRELIVLAEAFAEALGDRKAIGGALLETAALLASRDTSPTLEALAAAFEVPLAEIQSVIRDSRTDIGDIMRLAGRSSFSGRASKRPRACCRDWDPRPRTNSPPRSSVQPRMHPSPPWSCWPGVVRRRISRLWRRDWMSTWGNSTPSLTPSGRLTQPSTVPRPMPPCRRPSSSARKASCAKVCEQPITLGSWPPKISDPMSRRGTQHPTWAPLALAFFG
ncbi:MAG: hypothetical protein M3Y22_09165, partial [Pseudomonadota bacterium]|nr:hypothetical protein [Pseudomonadota bacterium]